MEYIHDNCNQPNSQVLKIYPPSLVERFPLNVPLLFVDLNINNIYLFAQSKAGQMVKV